jgi:hypothetical protein
MSRADDDYEDDRPRRRRRRDDDYDDYDDRPRKAKASGGGMNVWVIVGVVVGILFCCAVPAAIGLLLPAVQKVREAAGRAKDSNNFKQVGIGMFAHSDVTGNPPPADGDLSFRVHILPYVEQGTLHRQFDLKQAWDGPQNRKLSEVRVPTYVSSLDGDGFTQTRIRVFTGPDTMFPPGERPLRFAEVKDGTSNTFLAAEAADPVVWTQPQELVYTKNGPLPALGHPQRQTGFIVLMADGSVRFVKKPVDDAMIRAGITANSGDAPPQF